MHPIPSKATKTITPKPINLFRFEILHTQLLHFLIHSHHFIVEINFNHSIYRNSKKKNSVEDVCYTRASRDY